jgi:alcohol dehydrogenase, propanol-preferring
LPAFEQVPWTISTRNMERFMAARLHQIKRAGRDRTILVPMFALVLDQPGRPLRPAQLPDPVPGPGQVLVRVKACAVCRTDLHVVDGELLHPKLPLIPGHEIVGEVIACGPGPAPFAPGQRIGIPWLGHTCGSCPYCRGDRENLCDAPGFTGYTLDGGYAELTVAVATYCFPLPDRYGDAEAAPLLCAGLIGYRTLRLAGDARRMGVYGFGAAAHIVAQVARHEGRELYAFTRPGDTAAQVFARVMGAVWAGDANVAPPAELDAALIFAPVGSLVPAALSAVRKGGVVVCGGIHMSDIPTFPYRLLWEERSIRSVANLTRRDAIEFLALAAEVPIRTEVAPYPLAQANRALADLRHGRVQGAAVLVP